MPLKRSPAAPTAGNAPAAHAFAAPLTPRSRLAGWAALTLLIVAAAMLCGDFGITWDTGAHVSYGKDIVDYFRSGLTTPVGRDWTNIHDKGPLFDVVATALQQLLGVRPFPFWHFLIALFAILAVASTFAMARRIAGAPLAFLSAAALILMPQFFGHAFNNPKDIPFAGLFALCMLLGVRMLHRRTFRWPEIVGCGAAIGALLSMRIGGAIVVLYLAILAVYAVAQTYPARRSEQPVPISRGGMLLRIGVLLAVVWMVTIALWPYAHESPLMNPIRSLMRTKSFDRTYPVVFNGQEWKSNALPWYYMLEYFLIVTPLIFLPLAGLGVWRSIRVIAADWRSTRSLAAASVLLWFIAPQLYFAAVVPNMYDGLRHVLFIFPALAILIGLGADWIRERLAARFNALVGWVAVAVLFLLEAPALVRLHPYQVTYFNALAGDRATLHQRYDVDYWLSSMKEAAEWVNLRQAEATRPLRVVASVNEFSQLCFSYYASPRVEVLPFFSRERYQRLPVDIDYYVATTRYGFAENFPDNPIVHRIDADGALLLVIKGQRDAKQIGGVKPTSYRSWSNELGATLERHRTEQARGVEPRARRGRNYNQPVNCTYGNVRHAPVAVATKTMNREAIMRTIWGATLRAVVALVMGALSMTSQALAAPPPTVYVSELMASNNAGIVDEDGTMSDWIELTNGSSAAVDLLGFQLSDDAANPAKWLFPSITLQPGAQTIVWASNKNKYNPPNRPHTNFALSAGGEYLGLRTAAGVLLNEFAPFPAQTANISYGIDVNGNVRSFSTPTPGAPNGVGDPLTAAMPAASVARGFYSAPFTVELTSTMPTAAIYYTTNGSVPSATNGARYTTPIAISHTTPLRAVAVRSGLQDSPVLTVTYIFIADTINQGNGIPGFHNGTMRSAGEDVIVPEDTEMDPAIVNSSTYGPLMVEALTSIPSMTITAPVSSIINNGDGFYDWDESGLEPIYAASVELLYPNAPLLNQQIDAGAESHSHNRVKRSLRLKFRAEWGPATWITDAFRYAPVEGASATTEIRNVVLRGGNNRAWSRVSNPDATTYTEDELYRTSQIAMTGYGVHGTFVHLYLNGVYFGLYNMVERPDEDWLATYFGGNDDAWYFRNHGDASSGDPTRWNYLLNTVTTRDMSVAANYAELKQYLDVKAFADYMILNFWMGMTDWPDNNYYLGNRNGVLGATATPTTYWAWDGEWSLDRKKNSTTQGAWVHPAFLPNAPVGSDLSKLWQAARRSPAFMSMFSNRVATHTGTGGALSDAAAIARFDVLNAFIETAVIGESARWGDTLESIGQPTRTRNVDWNREVGVIRALLNGNANRLIAALTARGYYDPALVVSAPVIFPSGGTTTGPVTITATAGDAIKYTVDGSDPETSATALTYSGPFVLAQSSIVKAIATRGENVSPPASATLIVPAFAVTELHYNPAPATAAEIAAGITDKERFEFLELRNISSTPKSLATVRFTTGITFGGANVTVPAGGYVILASDAAAFAVRYGASVPVAGVYTGSLSNGGEQLTGENPSGFQFTSFTYDDAAPWPTSPDGSGPSLEVVVENGDRNDPATWAPSASANGTPGRGLNDVNPGSGAYQEIDGLLVFEAEGFDDAVDQGGASWTAVAGVAGASAGMIQALPNDGTLVTSAIETTSPRADYRVLISTPGTYRIWIRGQGDTAADNSVHVGVDGVVGPSITFMPVGPVVWSQTPHSGGIATLSFPTSGPHTVNLWMREDGARVDKLLLTLDTATVPSGVGPAVSPRAGGGDTTGEAAYQESGGVVAFEAEEFDTKVDQGGASWTAVAGVTGASAGMIQSLPNEGVLVISAIETTAPRADYRVRISTPGNYRVWIRGQGDTAADNSVHVGVDGVVGPSITFMPVGPVVWSQTPHSGGIATITFSTAGLHTVNVWMREDGTRVDKLLLTTDTATVPTGVGPAASPRIGGGDTTAPSVVSVTPESDAVGVAFDVSPQIVFSEPVTNTSGITLAPAAGGASVAAVVSVAGATVTIAPSSALTGSTVYRIAVPMSITDLAGNPLTSAFESFFTTAPAAYVESGGLLVFEAEGFDATVDRGGASWTAVSGIAGASAGMIQALPNEDVLVTNAIDTASPRADYHVLIASPGTYRVWVRGQGDTAADNSVHVGVDGVVGPSITFMPVGPVVWSQTPHSGGIATLTFSTAGLHTVNVWMREDGARVDKLLLTTDVATVPAGAGPAVSPRTAGGDTTPPTVVSVTPASNATGVAFGVIPQIVFSEPVTNSSGVTLAPAAGGASVAAEVSVSGSTITITPSSALTASTPYRITIPTSVTDLAGNPLASPFESLFTTADDAYQESGGLVVFEAEGFDATADQGGASWTPVDGIAGASAGMIQSLPNDETLITSAIDTTSPRADYRVLISTPGVYRVWVRGQGDTAADNSVHVGVDGVVGESITFMPVGALVWSQTPHAGGIATLTFATSGLHTVNLWMREDGTRVDKLLLTTDTAFVPSGVGPGVSQRIESANTTAPRVAEASPAGGV